jgi:hypothetical protein
MNNGPGTTSAGTRSIKHKTLSSYFPHIYKLQDYISISSGSSNADISRQSDPPEYTQLLTQTICGVSNAPTPGSVRIGKGTVGSQQECIDRILMEITRRDRGVGEARNVLLSTHRVSLNLSLAYLGDKLTHAVD